MSLVLPKLEITSNQTFNSKVDIRLNDGKLYICKVEDDGVTIRYGAELVLDALPASVLLGVQGDASATVIQSVLTLSGINFEDFDNDAREEFKQAVLDGLSVEAIVEIISVAAGSAIVDYIIIPSVTASAEDITSITAFAGDTSAITTQLANTTALSAATVQITSAPVQTVTTVQTRFMNSNIIPGSAGDAFDKITNYNAIGAFTEWNNIHHNYAFGGQAFYADETGVYMTSGHGNPAPKPGDGNFVVKIDDSVPKGMVLATSWHGGNDFGNTSGGVKMAPESMQIYNGDAYFYAGDVGPSIIKVPNWPSGEPVEVKKIPYSDRPSFLQMCVANDKIFYATGNGGSTNSVNVNCMNLDGSGDTNIVSGGAGTGRIVNMDTDGVDVFIVIISGYVMDSDGVYRYDNTSAGQEHPPRIFKFPVDYDSAYSGVIDLSNHSTNHSNFVYQFDQDYATIRSHSSSGQFLTLYENAFYWPSDFRAGESFDMLKLDLSTLTKEVLFTTDTVTADHAYTHNNIRKGGMAIANNKIYFQIITSSDTRVGRIIEWPLQSSSTYQVNFVGAYTSLVYSLDGGTETAFTQTTTTSGSTPIDLPATYTLTAKLKGTDGSVLHEITTSA